MLTAAGDEEPEIETEAENNNHQQKDVARMRARNEKLGPV